MAVAGRDVGSRVGSVVHVAVPPRALAALDQFSASWTASRRENAARVLVAAAEEAGTGVDDVVALSVRDSRKDYLTGIAVNAGANTAMGAKIAALGRALAIGLTDEARMDEIGVVLLALADVEQPHASVLAAMGEERAVGRLGSRAPDASWAATDTRFAPVGRAQLHRRFPAYAVALPGIVATLERHGLIARLPDAEQADYAYRTAQAGRRPSSFMPRGLASPDTTWRITVLGATVLRLLEQGADADDATGRGPLPGDGR